MKKAWQIAFVTLLVLTMSTPIFFSENKAQVASGENVYVGVTFGGTTVQEAEQLIDKVSSYTNLFVVDSWTIDGGPNSSALTEICDYAVQANMYFIVYFNFVFQNYTMNVGNYYNASTWEAYRMSPWHRPWLNEAKERYGDKFLGAYLYDEPGGKQIDLGYWNGNNMTFSGAPVMIYRNVSTYDDAERAYVSSIFRSGSMQVLTNTSYRYNLESAVPVFTSDYALYWFDYKAGYSTIFAEIGGNLGVNGKMEQIALCRGAATAQNKDWGAIVTLATDKPPTPENGSTMLNDMTMAYEAGAKYILVFDYEVNGPGSLTDEHFDAIKQFWNNIHSSSADSHGKYRGQVALVLPTNYGWGLRHENDKIWGFWPADNKSAQIWDNMNKLIAKYGLNLDIVYDDPQVSIQGQYAQTYLWNDTLNLAAEPSLANEVIVVAAVLGPVVAAAGLSEYWFSRRRKKSITFPL